MNGESVKIPLADPAGDAAGLRTEILAAMKSVLDAGDYILGPEVERFESAMAARLGVAGAVGVASGTDALALALKASGVEPGDEVVTVSHTSGATVAAIRMVGAIPVLIDIEAVTYCMDPAKLEAAISPRTRAVIPVHLYGHPASVRELKEIAAKHGIAPIEDCAQAIDASIDQQPVGSFGDAGCFSFYPTKNLGAIGDGGLVVSKDLDRVKRLRSLRTYGWSKPQFSELPGGSCSRLDELQAAILLVKLARLTEATERRRALAARYHEAFADLPIVVPRELPECRHVYHLYVIRTKQRDALAAWLAVRGISTGIHYPYPVHLQPGLAAGGTGPWPVAGLPITEAVSTEILSLPMFPSLTVAQQDQVIEALRAFFRQ